MWSVLACCGAALAGTDLYVSPAGNDAWSGRRAEPNAAKSDGPLASLVGARDAVRAARKAGAAPTPITVWVRGDTYFLTRPLQLTAEDGGTPASPIVYRAVPGETPILIGGRAVTGFTIDHGAVLKADLARQGLAGVAFRQLYFNGRRQPLARWPNQDPRHPVSGGWAYIDGRLTEKYLDQPGDSRRELHCRPADARHWQRPTEGEVLVFPRYNWWNNLIRIAKVDTQQRTITLAADASYALRPGDRYFVAGLREELDAPGEWYLDAARSTLYFWPPAAIDCGPVYVPVVKNIVELGPGTAHVTLRGFTLECCSGSAIRLQDCRQCLVAGCTIRNVSGYQGAGVTISGGRECGVVGCDIDDVGCHGIALNGGDQKTLTPAGHYADNNHIAHVGALYKQGCGGSIGGVGNRASHNLIHHVPRWCISPMGNNHTIELNHLHHASLETEDTGAIYVMSIDWLSGYGTLVRHNFIHDVLGFGRDATTGRWTSPYFAWGIYLDWSPNGVRVEGNLVARTPRGAIMVHDGRDNRLENNILVDAAQQQIECSGWTTKTRFWTDGEKRFHWSRQYDSVAGQAAWRTPGITLRDPRTAPLADGHTMHHNRVLRNVLYYHNPQAKAILYRHAPCAENPSDNNLVWNMGHPVRTDQFRAGRTVGANLVPNPGFEERAASGTPQRWSWHIHPSAKDQAQACDDHPHGGRFCLRFAGTPEAANKDKPQWARVPSFRSEELAAEPGATYRLAVWLRAAQAHTAVEIGAQAYRAGKYHWMAAQTVSVGTEWTPYELAFPLPGPNDRGYHAEMRRFYVRLRLPAETGTVWADDVTLHRAEPLTQWGAWQALGQDQHSLVADPRFVAPEKDDYRLRSDSPAWKLGFQPIPLEKIGPYQSELRATWPVVERPETMEEILNP
jgi:hypothetical protein